MTAALISSAAAFAAEPVSMVQNQFDQVKVFPNPWRADRNASPLVTIDAIPTNSTVKIYTTSGHWVKTLPVNGTQALWDLTNDHGDKVASGIYMYVITANSDKKVGKIAVIR